MARLCETPGATLAVRVIARSRSRRVIVWSVGRCSMRTMSPRRTSPPPPVRTSSRWMSSGRCRWGESSRTRMSKRRPLSLNLPIALAADRRVDRVADLGHRDPEVGRLVAVGDDLHLGHADLVVAVDVGHEARLPHLLHDHARGAPERVPVRGRGC